MKKFLTGIFSLSLLFIACYAMGEVNDLISAFSGGVTFATLALSAARIKSGVKTLQENAKDVQDLQAATSIVASPDVPAVDDFTLTIDNSSEEDNDVQNAILFNAGSLVSSSDTGSQGADITITKVGSQASYTNFLNVILTIPFCIKGFGYGAPSQSQFNNTFTEYLANGSNASVKTEMQPKIYKLTVLTGIFPNIVNFTVPWVRKIRSGYAIVFGQNPNSSSTLAFSTISESQWNSMKGRLANFGS